MRLINADRLKIDFGFTWDDIAPTREEMFEIIDRQPTVDAVEVVRCKECKHCYVDGENVRYNVCDLNHNKVQADDWFCADAERGGNGGSN